MLHVATLYIIIKDIKDYESSPTRKNGKRKTLNMQNTVDIMIK